MSEGKNKFPEHVVEFFINPKNIGRMTDPDGAAMVKGQCGDTMEMYLEIKDENISRALFHTDGCGITAICGSVVTSLAEGRSIEDALRISPADVIDRVKDVLGTGFHCAILAVSTLHKALADYLIKRGK